ncbi:MULTISPECIES: MotA/TolQ/ExbB proton channel family protein [unclassified Thioalkalivibrio]|uniref:MotA/TolQ/ExbB proton channel family protein n=1 Tax=unclassified Thioalkalivibrio TaxID=2621013 RepID=UPI000414003A|nr:MULTISPECIES: MotA/TolQ/ExbB proton channel family protein [unclassified Thioalkalivibrio]PYG04429.1 outer membrane transport energization protein ExbB [Thioalkalivibrio sp. ALE21]
MSFSITMELMDTVVSWLLEPVIIGLLVLVAVAVWELGQAVGERTGGVRRLEVSGNAERLAFLARRRIDRADLLARIGPMLGLMGTLIPLGPGLAAMGRGELDVLAQAVTVAFNTTVLGLLIGILGFLLGRLRRRWYDGAMERMEAA